MVRVKGQFFYLFVNWMDRFHLIHEATGHKGHENIDKTETDLKILSLPCYLLPALCCNEAIPEWPIISHFSHAGLGHRIRLPRCVPPAVWPWKYFNWFQINRSDAGRKCPNTGFWYSCVGCNQISTLSSRSLYRYVTDKGCRVLLVLLFGSKLHGYL